MLTFKLLDFCFEQKFQLFGFNTVLWLLGDQVQMSPSCDIFPTELYCEYSKISLSGTKIVNGGFCVLSSNYFYGKLFVFFWFLYIITFIVSVLAFLFRLVNVCIKPLFKKTSFSAADQFVIDVIKNDLLLPEFKSFIDTLNQLIENDINF